jgi:hypothetical protein
MGDKNPKKTKKKKKVTEKVAQAAKETTAIKDSKK